MVSEGGDGAHDSVDRRVEIFTPCRGKNLGVGQHVPSVPSSRTRVIIPAETFCAVGGGGSATYGYSNI